ncbi:hypothetical protein [Acidaminococcus massiliensis]|uniref:hypothetical protein n=1 Tax=Acidaminococcus massiliensis TaxID=1852375 RepID=UPI0022E428A9|nr:hypothetical protein [Acidaminococcus massiliensis]
MDERYTKLAAVPETALKPISFGKLKGKSDINPQWRYEALTDVFGLCGEGWRYEIADTKMVPVQATGELMVFVFVNLYIKTDNGWSAPIPGSGGDFLIQKDKNGLHGNDEGFKMAITDALGTAAKMVGVAASVYRGQYKTKYQKEMEEEPSKPTVLYATQKQQNDLEVMCQKTGADLKKVLAWVHCQNIKELTVPAWQRAVAGLRIKEQKEAKA